MKRSDQIHNKIFAAFGITCYNCRIVDGQNSCGDFDSYTPVQVTRNIHIAQNWKWTFTRPVFDNDKPTAANTHSTQFIGVGSNKSKVFIVPD